MGWSTVDDVDVTVDGVSAMVRVGLGTRSTFEAANYTCKSLGRSVDEATRV